MTQYLSFDIGGTNLKYALIDKAGKIIEKGSTPSKTTSLEDFLTSIYEVGDQYRGQFEGIAVCAPGKIDTKKKIIHYGGALPILDGLNLQETLGVRYNVPVGAENDGKAAALCEQWLGELQDLDSGAVMTLGTGVGGGIIIDHHLLHGNNFQAGELSWMILDRDTGVKKLDSYAGALCSAVLMVRRINQTLHHDDLNNGRLAFEAINNKNDEALKIFEQYCLNVAILIMNIQSVINGEKIVIAGGISSQPILIKEIKHQFDRLLENNPMLNDQVVAPEIVAAKYKNDANLYGALYSLLLEIDR